MTPARCARCHRPLSAPSRDGLGPVCRRRRSARPLPRLPNPARVYITYQGPVVGQADLFDLLEENQ
jgi:hypothetical protein